MKICRSTSLLSLVLVALTSTLRAADADDKRYAGATLSEWKALLETIDPNAKDRGRWVPGLVALVADESLSSNDRRRFGLRLARMKSDAAPAVPYFVQVLKQRHKNRDYLWAARALGLMGKAAAPATPALIEFLGDDRIPVIHRTLAIEPLGWIATDHPDAIPKLTELLQTRPTHAISASDAFEFRTYALQAFTLVGPDGDIVTPLIIRILRDPRHGEFSRIHATRALGALRYRGALAIQPLSESLEHDPSPAVRDEAAIALRMLGTDGVNRLVGYLSHGSSELRWRAAQQLGEIRKDDIRSRRLVQAPLLKAQSDREDLVRLHAVSSLLKLRLAQPQSIMQLASLLASKDRTIRMKAMELLVSQPSINSATQARIQSLQQHPDPKVRRLAKKTLAKMPK